MIVTCDMSCHLINGQHAGLAAQKMFTYISGLNLVELNGADVCCGAAGVYNLMEQSLSGQILREKIENIRRSGASVLATGNPGCHMQIGAGARLAGLDIKVCHPVELLDESYRKAGLYR
ncbi:MAG: heterodisulfide reductase-related iron-sulfur binding cluster, partial [Pyrinomonadaceae bacterium]